MITIGNKKYNNSGIYMGRPSLLGNPFEIGKDGTRTEVIKKFKDWFYKIKDTEPYKTYIKTLIDRAKTEDLCLICWCHPLPCHVEIIKEYIESVINEDIIFNNE